MATVDISNSTNYFSISDGLICKKHKEPIEGKTKERITKTGKVVHESFYRGLEGRIVAIDTRDSEYGKSWKITLQDNEGNRDVLEFQYSSGYANGFLKALPNVDLSKEVVIIPNMKIENDKKRATIFLKQNDVTLKWFYSKEHNNGIPELKKVKIKGKETWDDSDIMEFLEAMVNDTIKPKLNAAPVVVEAAVEDLPF